MKLFIINLFLLLSGQDSDFKKESVSASAKEVIENIEGYSAKESVEVYSAKSAKVPIEMPPEVYDMLMDPPSFKFPILPPLPPINPPPVTNVNP